MIDLDQLAPADRALWDAMGDAVPRFTVLPTPGACHELAACRVTARILRTPLMPWQEWAIRIITERDAAGRYRYPFFVITVPRQSGKTTLVRIIILTRMILYVGRRSFYTAQTGKDAMERWADLVAVITDEANPTPLAPLVTVRKAAGSSRLILKPTGSRFVPFAPTAKSLHGYTPHDVAIDELFALDDASGDELLGAIIPATATILDRQIIGLSTAGNALSTFLRRLVKAGRAICGPVTSADLLPGEVAGARPSGFAEWSLAPACDPYDEAGWTFHPALGHTVTMHTLREDAAGSPRGVWIRGYCNQWTVDEVDEPLFDMARVAAAAIPAPEYPPLDGLVVGFGSALDRSAVAAVAAWRLPTSGRLAAHVLHMTGDAAGFVDFLDDLAAAGARLFADDGGANRAILDELRRRFPLGSPRAPRAFDVREWVLASAGLHTALDPLDPAAPATPRLAIPGELDELGKLVADPVMRAGIAGALQRPLGETWALSHKGSPVATALAAALRGLDTHVDTPKPTIFTLDDDDER